MVPRVTELFCGTPSDAGQEGRGGQDGVGRGRGGSETTSPKILGVLKPPLGGPRLGRTTDLWSRAWSGKPSEPKGRIPRPDSSPSLRVHTDSHPPVYVGSRGGRVGGGVPRLIPRRCELAT